MLYHWDLPQCLQEKGGWLNRDCAEWFAEYAGKIFGAFPTEIPYWGTILEPQIHAYHGYWDGKHAPGMHDFSSALLAAHNLLRGHGLAVRAFRASEAEGEIGITNYLPSHYPVSDSPEDIAAARRWDGCWNRWFPLPPIGISPAPRRQAFWGASAGRATWRTTDGRGGGCRFHEWTAGNTSGWLTVDS